jgi:polyphenol oxidase
VRLVSHGIPVFTSEILSAVPGINHAFTTRNGGVSVGPYASMNLSATIGDSVDAVTENRDRLADVLGVGKSTIRLQTQIHGGTVERLTHNTGSEPLSADAFLTSELGVPAIVGIADCVPVLLATRDGRAVGAVHAGWRGAVAGVVSNAIDSMANWYDANPAELCAAIGPAIGSCCFEVGEEVAGSIPEEFVVRNQTKPHVDLPGFVQHQLVSSGIAPDRIDVTEICTKCRPDLCFSHRGGEGNTGRMVGAIVRTP